MLPVPGSRTSVISQEVSKIEKVFWYFYFFSSSLEIDSLVFESGRTNCMLNVVECQSSVLEEVQND